MATYTRPDPTFPAVAENGSRAPMSAQEVGQGWSTTSQTRPPADKFNEKDFLTSAGVKYLCQLGIAEYDWNEHYQGKGLVIASNGSVYWNTSPCQGVDPADPNGTDLRYWEKTAVRAQDAKDILLGEDVTAGYLTVQQAYQLFLNFDWWNSAAGAPPNDNQLWQFAIHTDQSLASVYALVNEHNGRLSGLESTTSSQGAWIADANDNRFPLMNAQIGNAFAQLVEHWQRMDAIQAQLNALLYRVDTLISGGGSPSSGWRLIENGFRPTGNMLIQWRSDFSHDYGAGEVSRWLDFPLAFPTTCWNVQVSTGRASGQNDDIMSYQIQDPVRWTNNGVQVFRARRGDDGPMDTWPIITAYGN